MSNKRITDLTELTNPTTDDVFPIVDIATNTTQKVQVGNLPIQTAVTTALATKQDTLVSGTNIKTLNNTSLLGSGNIVLTANPSGVAGAIQFSNGSAFASDATNLFWDDTNNRLGIGTNAPSSPLDIINDSISSAILNVGPSFARGFQITNTNSTANPVYVVGLNPTYINTRIGFFNSLTFRANGTEIAEMTSSEVRVGGATGARLGIKGSGSTSATTSLLVQNSGGTGLLTLKDNGDCTLGASSDFGNISGTGCFFRFSLAVGTLSNATASAILQADSTTRGFLPPRMTTTQKNAIATPAAGLVVYDSTTNKLCCYNGSTWNDLF